MKPCCPLLFSTLSQGVLQPVVSDKTSGSKMLKKARSFRDDLKVRIKRRPSTGVQQMIPQEAKNGKVKDRAKGDNPSGDEHEADDVSTRTESSVCVCVCVCVCVRACVFVICIFTFMRACMPVRAHTSIETHFVLQSVMT